MPNIAALITVAAVMFAVLGAITLIAHIYNLNNIKSKNRRRRSTRHGSVGKQSGDTKDLPPHSVHAKEMA